MAAFCSPPNLRDKNSLSTLCTENLTCRPRISCNPLRPRFAEQEISASAVKKLVKTSACQRACEFNMAASSSPAKTEPEHGRLVAIATQQEREIMKKMLLSMVLAVVAPFAWAQVSETTTTTTTTEGSGTITEYTPGSAIILRESSGPRTYRFGKTVTYVTRSGKVL